LEVSPPSAATHLRNCLDVDVDVDGEHVHLKMASSSSLSCRQEANG
jgi:hypothetical protein